MLAFTPPPWSRPHLGPKQALAIGGMLPVPASRTAPIGGLDKRWQLRSTALMPGD